MHRPADLARGDRIARYSGYGPVFNPKAPPTSSVMTRSRWAGTPRIGASPSRNARACEQQRRK
jgi:hypothetical protein